MNRLALGITISTILLTGCSTTCNVKPAKSQVTVNNPVAPTQERIIYKTYSDAIPQRQANYGWLPPTNSYKPLYNHKLLSDYTKQLAMKLIENMRYVTDRTPIAVTSFVDLDNNLKTTNLLGNQLAESFITEMQEFGLAIVDFKHTGMIETNQNGDFAFSRQAKQLKSNINVQYILSGTLTYNDRGVIVNTRIIGTESKVVVASAKGFIPHFIINSLHNGRRRDGIPLNAIN
jgi:TolB-like protein